MADRMTNAELITLARKRAREHGKPMPRTGADVERLTGFHYTGPDPQAIGKTYTVQVRNF